MNTAKVVHDTITIDPGDPVPNWDSVTVMFCWIDDCLSPHPDSHGVYTAYADTGEYWLSPYCTRYLPNPPDRSLHLLSDTSGGLGFLLNYAHCRVHGTLENVSLPLSPPVWISAHSGNGQNGYSTWAPVDMMTGTWEIYLCDGDWTIDPPVITNWETPLSAALTIGEPQIQSTQ